jgi:2-polyprenyl-3-methyl-5-hydroxy-6-metoxy-1,4-benzoquinol methylase
MSSHQQIVRLLKELRPKQVLDVGAAQGFLGQMIKAAPDVHPGLQIDAVEMNPVWAEHCQPFYRTVHASTIEEAHLPDKTYDAIVCGDVLEHVPDPVGVIHQLKRIATDDAAFIISVPNIAHLGVRMMLLFGKFPKMERGPLDKTHLHFFTRDTAEAMLRQAGLRVERVSSTGVPLDELWKRGEGNLLYRALMRTQHVFVRLLPRLFGMQWIFLARPEKPR